MVLPYRDPSSYGNSEKFRVKGSTCIEDGCTSEAGTLWGKYWCPRHNAERLDRISSQFENLLKGRGK
jgi:hypothetical protein